VIEPWATNESQALRLLDLGDIATEGPKIKAWLKQQLAEYRTSFAYSGLLDHAWES
jgi:hypothetical protein